MRKTLPVIVAILLAALASVGIVRWAKQISAEGRTWRCVVAARDLKVGATLSLTDLTVQSIRAPSSTRGGVWEHVLGQLTQGDKMGTLAGRVLRSRVSAGSPILESALKPVGLESKRANWKTKIPKGTRAVSIPVRSTGAVSGLVEVGDHVDVLVNLSVPTGGDDEQKISFPVPMGNTTQNIDLPYRSKARGEAMTFYLLQDVEILAVGSQTATIEEMDFDDPLARLGATAGGGGVTVALTPEQIQILVFAISNGNSEFTLTLRPPGDVSQMDPEQMAPSTFQALLTAVGFEQ